MRVFHFPRTSQQGLTLYVDREIKLGIDVNVTLGWFNVSLPFCQMEFTW